MRPERADVCHRRECGPVSSAVRRHSYTGTHYLTPTTRDETRAQPREHATGEKKLVIFGLSEDFFRPTIPSSAR